MASNDMFRRDSVLYYKEMIPIANSLKGHLRSALPRGVDIDDAASDLANAFILCDTNIFKKYFDLGLDPNIVLKGGHTLLTILLCFATSETWTAVAKLLLEKGCSPTAEDPTGVPVISLLVRSGATDLVAYSLECGASIEMGGSAGETPLLSAVHYKQTDCLKCLLNKGADPNAIGRDDNSPLMWAAGRSNGIGMQRSLTCVKLLISNGANVNFRNPRGYTPLMAASLIREIDTVHTLLSSGADTEIKDDKGETALIKAVDGDSEEVVRILLNHRADANTSNKIGISPLMRASSSWVIESLLVSGASPNAESDAGDTPLHYQAESNNTMHVQLLLEFGANLDARNSDGDTPLQLTIRRRSDDAMKLLLGAGSSCETTNRHGFGLLHDTLLPWDYFRTIDIFSKLNTPALLGELFFYAQTRRGWSYDTLKLLIKEGVNVNIQNEGGVTPLMIASITGDILSVKLLLDSGADSTIVDNNNRTSLFYAVKSGCLRLAEILIGRGCEINARDNNENLPIYYAAQFNYMDLTQLFMLEFAFFYCSIKGLM